MKKRILFLIVINSFITLHAQSKNDLLINKTFSINIGSVCEETPEPNPCAGFEIFFILHFTKNNVSVLEKNISSCDSEDIVSKLNYKWEFTKNSEIKIYSNSKEIQYNFLKDLVLKIEKKKIVGYKKNKRFEFEKL